MQTPAKMNVGNLAPPWLLGPEIRDKVRQRLRRKPAFTVTSWDRSVVRNVHRVLSEAYPGILNNLRILPISSLEWTSEFRTIDGIPLIVFDVEQANALGFLCALELQREKPIFHYIEHVIRAAEMMLSLGDERGALLCAQRNYSRLVEYAHRLRTHARIKKRPIYPPGLEESKLVIRHVVPYFVLAHEAGHSILKSDMKPEGLHDDITAIWWSSIDYDETLGVWSYWFIQPEIVYALDEDGKPSTSGTRGMNLELKNMEAKLIEESFADFFALICVSEMAAMHGLPHSMLWHSLVIIFEGMERQLLLRRIVNRVPREVRRAAIVFEGSRLQSRIFILCRMIDRIASGGMRVPGVVYEYWHDAPSELLAFFSSSDEVKQLARWLQRSNVTARGAFILGTGATLPRPEEVKDFIRDSEPLAEPLSGYISVMSAPALVPRHFYELEQNDDWTPDKPEGGNSGLIGFTCAARDVTECLFRSKYVTECLLQSKTLSGEIGWDYLQAANPDASAEDLVRAPRIMARSNALYRGSPRRKPVRARPTA
jgi:hypothetical protein